MRKPARKTVKPTSGQRRFCVAPMMDVTDRHCRYFFRLLSRQAWLYTEMVTTGALLHGDAARHLYHDVSEHPVALQLGGSDPTALAACARLADAGAYDEINLNCGCPSDRVQSGRFGACLMAEPELVAECVAAMRAVTPLPITVKTRIGIDQRDSYEHLCAFVGTVAAAGCRTFIVHARKAWLKGLNPRENRSVPPLRHDLVAHLKQDYPHLEIILNGGLTTLNEVVEKLDAVDGVMLGRAVARNPYLLSAVDARFYGATRPLPERTDILMQYAGYAARREQQGVTANVLLRPLLGLFQGEPAARHYRRALSEGRGSVMERVDQALFALADRRCAAYTPERITAL